MENKILPTQESIARLAEVLANNVGGGVMDLVWGPDIDVKFVDHGQNGVADEPHFVMSREG